MEGEELKAGKARVLEHLIEPLTNLGFMRKRGVTLDVHSSMMDTLAARLSYMNESSLLALAEIVEAHGLGSNKDQWPAIKLICDWARNLQAPPPSESRLVRSYLQSAPGKRAVDGGYIVELRQFLKRNGRPPSEYDMKSILSSADENSRHRMRIEAGSSISDQDQQWLNGYSTAHGICMGIVDGRTSQASN